MSRVLVAADRLFQGHTIHPGHPESPQRLSVLEPVIRERHIPLLAPLRPATEAELLRIHTPRYMEHLKSLDRVGGGQLDPDTALGPASLHIARVAAGASIDLAGALMRGEADAGFALVRPPGHHATADRGMGFCVLNNLACAAADLVSQGKRVAVLDWDVHHGNGTQDAFYDCPDVLVISMHQQRHYPHSGEPSELGEGEGRGANRNIPLPAGCRDADYLHAFERLAAPVLAAHGADVLLVSAGFDPHRLDQLGGMGVTTEGFRALLRKAREATSGVPAMLVLEGGYALDALVASVAACLDELLGDTSELDIAGEAHAPIRTLVEQIASEWGDVD